MLCQLEKQRLGALVEELLGAEDRAIRLTLRRELGLLARYLRCKKYYRARHTKKPIRKRVKILGIALIGFLGAAIADAPDVGMMDSETAVVALASLDDYEE